MSLGVAADSVVVLALGAIVSLWTLSLRSLGVRVLLAFFFLVLSLDILFGVLGVDIYPFSNLLVLSFAVLGGSLLGRPLSKRKYVFAAVLIAVSALDVLSFAGPGPNAPSGGPPPSRPTSLEYLNFTILSGSAHFILGSFDLLLVSLAVTFFDLGGFGKLRVVVFAPVALVFPVLFPFSLLTPAANSGIPVTPFISAIAFLFYITTRTRSAAVTSSRSRTGP